MKWRPPSIHGLVALAALMLGSWLAATASGARAETPLLTFGELLRIQALTDSAALSAEDRLLSQNVEFYTYTVFETLQMANSTALLVREAPLFCAPEGTFRFGDAAGLADLADLVTAEVLALGEDAGIALERYAEQPASAVLLIGLRAAFPCIDPPSTLAQR
jgi:hypothetical protein